jgi:hypothetical protein
MSLFPNTWPLWVPRKTWFRLIRSGRELEEEAQMMGLSKQFVLDIRKPEAPQDDKQQCDSTTNKFTRQFKIRHILGCPRSTRCRSLLEILTTGKGGWHCCREAPSDVRKFREGSWL